LSGSDCIDNTIVLESSERMRPVLLSEQQKALLLV
jgi:hypothetical protein